MNLFVIFSASAIAILSIVVIIPFSPWMRSSRSFVEFADLVVRNATIFTSDSYLPFAEAMVVKNGRILRVGSYSSVQDLVGSETRDMNLEGKVVVPGFIDSHLHFLNGGLQMGQVGLRGVTSQAEFVRKVKQALEDACQGCWILGGGWNNDFWGGNLPESSWIDDITPNNPVWLSRMDGHMGLANHLALKIAGITSESNDPIGGTIVRTNNGEPTGLLVDAAMKLVLSLIPDISVEQRRDALAIASKHALSRGVTTVVDFGRFFPGAPADHVWQDFLDVYKWADSVGKMLIRVSVFFPMQTWPRLVDLVQENGRALSEKIYLGGVKAFADGSLGSSSALFYEPYVNEPDNYGLLVADLDWLLNATSASDRSGLQVAIHAIGDKANDVILDVYDSVFSSNGLRDRRFRSFDCLVTHGKLIQVEHVQHLAAGAPERFGRSGLIASVQPQHLLDDADSAEKKIGSHRADTGSYLFRSLKTSGAELAFGSDWPVSDIDPLEAIRTAIKRIPPGWGTAWNPEECLSLDDALIASTISAAYASFLDNDLGSLSSGKLADFVLLSAKSWAEFSENPSPKILATYVSGLQAYP